MKKTLLLLSTVLLSATSAFSQTPTDTVTRTKIRVYSPDAVTSKTDNAYKWVVKTDVLAFLTGEFALGTEYRISNKFSAEASAGVTYAFIGNGVSLFDNDEYSHDDMEAKMGSAFRGTIKYYPSSDYDAIEGWSFGIQLFSKTTNHENTYDDYLNSTSFTDKKVKTGASLIIAKQLFQDSNIAFEYFIGIGMASVKRDYSDWVYSSNNVDGAYEQITTKKTVPNFQMGFKIGFGN